MRLLARNLDKDGLGEVKVKVDDAEDLWMSYNLICTGDLVTASTVRRVQKENSAGTVSSSRVRMTITIQIQQSNFDAHAGLLRLSGKNARQNQYIRMGAYHTVDIIAGRQFSIMKDLWDSVALSRLDEACDPAKGADVVVIVMQEGLAHLCLITRSMTVPRARIETTIPRKRRSSTSGHDKAMERFYDGVYEAILNHVDFTIVRCVIVASPGFTKDQFMEYAITMAARRDDRVLLENKSKFLICHASSGHRRAIRDVLADPTVQQKLSNTKAAGEVQVLQSFFDMLATEPDRAFYGHKHVVFAASQGAIQALLISDHLFRSTDIATRKEHVRLVEEVKSAGGDVFVFSTMHVTGEELSKFTGLAAILRFPLMLDDDSELEEEEEEMEEITIIQSDGEDPF